MPIPWKTRAARKGPTEPPGSTPGSARITQPTMYASPPAVNARTPPTRSTTMPVTKAAGIWTRAAVPTISPICGSGTPACASATGSVAVNAWKPAWTAKTAKARRSIRASSRNGRPADRSPAPAVRARGRVGGSAGPAGARRARRTLAAAAALPCIRGCTATYLRLHAPPPSTGRASGGSSRRRSRGGRSSVRRRRPGRRRSPTVSDAFSSTRPWPSAASVPDETSEAWTLRSRRGRLGGVVIGTTVGSGRGIRFEYRSQNSSTSSGSNCVPACWRSSAMAASCDMARLYGRSWVIASYASAMATMRAPSGISLARRPYG